MTRKKRDEGALIEQSLSPNRRPVQPPTVIQVRGVAGPLRGVIERQFRIVVHEESLCRGEFRGRRQTADDRAMIKSAVWAINDIRTYIGLEPVSLPFKNVHFIRHDDYNRAFVDDDSSGRTLYRQVFIQDGKVADRPYTMIRLTHELVHAMAFNMYVVFAELGNEDDMPTLHITNWRHSVSGFPCIEDQFVGLNEVATEIIATMVRYRLPEEKNTPFSEDELERIARGGAYGPQVGLVLEFLTREFGETAMPTTWLTWDYLTGSNDFLRTVRRRNPTAYQALKMMGGDAQSVYDAALMLGYEDIAEDIYECYIVNDEDED